MQTDKADDRPSPGPPANAAMTAPSQGSGTYDTTPTTTSGSPTAMVGRFTTDGGQCRGLLYAESGGGPVVPRRE